LGNISSGVLNKTYLQQSAATGKPCNGSSTSNSFAFLGYNSNFVWHFLSNNNNDINWQSVVYEAQLAEPAVQQMNYTTGATCTVDYFKMKTSLLTSCTISPGSMWRMKPSLNSPLFTHEVHKKSPHASRLTSFQVRTPHTNFGFTWQWVVYEAQLEQPSVQDMKYLKESYTRKSRMCMMVHISSVDGPICNYTLRSIKPGIITSPGR
jgi:hypothetical protein